MATLQPPVQLEHRRLFDLPDTAGVQVRCTRGCLWITVDGDERDFVLAAGEVFHTVEHRRALIYALEPSMFVLETAVGSSAASGETRLRPTRGSTALA